MDIVKVLMNYPTQNPSLPSAFVGIRDTVTDFCFKEPL